MNWSAAVAAEMPAGVVTVMCTVWVPVLSTVPVQSGLVTVIFASESTVRFVAAAAPKLTPVAPVKPLPVMTTRIPSPVGPRAGETLVIAGAWLTVRVKDWVASGCTPLAALIVSG